MKVAIAGYTGLIGESCLEMLIKDNEIQSIVCVGRKKPIYENPKVEFIESNFEKALNLNADSLICCLGTTIKIAGSQEAFYKVDHDFVITFRNSFPQAKTMAVVSAVGADPASSVFYNRVKGEMERDLAQSGLDSLSILHPSILLGNRKEFRLGERIGIVVMQLFSPFMLGSLAKFKPIKASVVANTLIKSVQTGKKGINILEGDDLRN